MSERLLALSVREFIKRSREKAAGGVEISESKQMNVMRMIRESIGGIDVDPSWELTQRIETVVLDWAVEESAARRSLPVARLYVGKARSVAFNLGNANNPSLLAAVMADELSVERLVTMTPHEMYPELRDAYFCRKKEIEEWVIAQKTRMSELQSGLFACGRCKSGDTEYVQMQTRSADEPMTNFHWCNNCGKRWRS